MTLGLTCVLSSSVFLPNVEIFNLFFATRHTLCLCSSLHRVCNPNAPRQHCQAAISDRQSGLQHNHNHACSEGTSKGQPQFIEFSTFTLTFFESIAAPRTRVPHGNSRLAYEQQTARMDLFQALGIPQDAAYRASEPRNSNFSSSRTMAAPSSSAPHIFSPSQQPMASQGFSVSQNMPDGLNPLSVMERPPNCGQDESWIPSSGQRPNLSSQTLSHPGSMQHTQDENRMPGIEQGFRCYSQSSQPHDNLGDSVEDLTDDTCSPQIQSMEEYLNENIDTRKPKLVPATVPRSTGEWKTKLQHLCDKHGVRPQFDYKEMSEQRFVATLTVSGRLFQTTAPQLSKKLAQEEACKLAIAETPSLETMDGIEGAGKRGKKRKSEDLSLQGRSEEWVGIINSMCAENRSSLESRLTENRSFTAKQVTSSHIRGLCRRGCSPTLHIQGDNRGASN